MSKSTFATSSCLHLHSSTDLQTDKLLIIVIYTDDTPVTSNKSHAHVYATIFVRLHELNHNKDCGSSRVTRAQILREENKAPQHEYHTVTSICINGT